MRSVALRRVRETPIQFSSVQFSDAPAKLPCGRRPPASCCAFVLYCIPALSAHKDARAPSLDFGSCLLTRLAVALHAMPPVDLAACAANHYPRLLRDVISEPDRKLLAQVYWRRIHGSLTSTLTYFNLLRAMVEADEADFGELRAVLARIQQRIAREFGDRFVVVNDFFSYRSAHTRRLFPGWHQDYEFWLTGSACTSFNLWVLLDHNRLNGSIDIYEVGENRWMYEQLYQLVGGGGGHNRSAGGAPSMVPTSFFKSYGGREQLMRSPSAGVPEPRVSNTPLGVGDALVVRQLEIHRTDRQELQAEQWRLALGFKVIERLPLTRAPLEDSPFSGDLGQVSIRWPGLVPQLQLGKPFPDVYGARLASYRLEPETWANHARRLLALRPELVMLLVPVSLIASVLVLAVRNDVAAAKKVGARGVPMEAGRRMPLASTLARCARRLLRALI